MVDQEQLGLLRRSVEEWNKWREKNFGVEIDLEGAYLQRANLQQANLQRARLLGANLEGADLEGANLKGADLEGANLKGAYLQRAKLQGAYLGRAKLQGAYLQRANLLGVNLKGAYLQGVYLLGAYLQRANLLGANLEGAYLEGANLQQAKLIVTQALTTNFQNANLTGACIQDWHINSETQFGNVICEYIYLKEKYQGNQFVLFERRPHDHNKNFAPGDFARLVQQASQSLDLIFSEGIDWTAFAQTFQGLQIETQSDELSIQAIEKKRDGSFVVKVDVPVTADKAALEKEFWGRYQPLLEAKDREIKHQKELLQEVRFQNTNLTEMVKILGSRPTTINNTFMPENNPKYTEVEMNNMGGGQATGWAGKVGRDQVVHNKTNLAESAVEIQQLLQILDKSYPSDIPEDTQAEIDVAVKRINKDLALKERVVGALKAGGLEALKEITDNPYVNILVAAYEGWREPS